MAGKGGVEGGQEGTWPCCTLPLQQNLRAESEVRFLDNPETSYFLPEHHRVNHQGKLRSVTHSSCPKAPRFSPRSPRSGILPSDSPTTDTPPAVASSRASAAHVYFLPACHPVPRNPFMRLHGLPYSGPSLSQKQLGPLQPWQAADGPAETALTGIPTEVPIVAWCLGLWSWSPSHRLDPPAFPSSM